MPTVSIGDARAMVDTNILVYSFTPDDVWKQREAVMLIGVRIVNPFVDLTS